MIPLAFFSGPWGGLAKAVLIALAIAAVWGHGWMQGAHHEEVKAAAFVGGVQALGDAAIKRAADNTRKANAIKESADAEHEKNLADVFDVIRWMRKQTDSRGSGVPAAPAGTTRPDLACFDRAELERAHGNLIAGVRSVADEGTKSAIDLNTGKRWYLKLSTEIKP